MFFENFINVLDVYHQNRIINFIKPYRIKYYIDVGAHKGEFLSYILKLKYFKIYCFEPQKKAFDKLKIKAKNKRINIYNFGLGHKNQYLNFHVNKLSSTSTFSKYKNTIYLKFKNYLLNSSKNYLSRYPVKIKKLDNVLKDEKIKDSFLKIDVEGFELNVLKGSKQTISKKVKFILIEKQFFQMYKNYSYNKIEEVLRQNNFRLIRRFNYPLLNFQDNLYIKKNRII